MKSKFIFTSAFCTLSTLSTFAYGQSSVTLYGVVDGGLSYSQVSGDYIKDKTNIGLAYGMQSGNRLGLKGSEDLGEGNRLTFQLENGFDLGNGTIEQNARLFGRQAWFGVENDQWGYARVGRQYNFATDYFGAIDPFMLGFGQASMGAAFGTTNMYRMSNAVKYQTPSFSGFQAGLGYSFAVGEVPFYYNQGLTPNAFGSTGYNYLNSNNNRQITLGAKYASGPFYAAVSYDKLFGTNEVENNSGVNPYAWNIGASYDFSVVKVALAYGQMRDGVIRGEGDGMTGANEFYNPYWGTGNKGSINFNQRVKQDSYLAGLTIPLNGSSRVFASWTFINDKTSDVTPANQSSYNVGYSYDFTKRTNMYAFFSYMNNVSTNASNKSSVLGIGMRHMF